MSVNQSIYFYKTSSGREIISEFIDKLDIKTKSRIRNGLRLLEKYGLGLLGEVWVKKIHINPNIFELRIIGTVQVRLLFCKYDQNRFLIVHAFIKKTNKTPIKEFKLAIKRAKEFI